MINRNFIQMFEGIRTMLGGGKEAAKSDTESLIKELRQRLNMLKTRTQNLEAGTKNYILDAALPAVEDFIESGDLDGARNELAIHEARVKNELEEKWRKK